MKLKLVILLCLWSSFLNCQIKDTGGNDDSKNSLLVIALVELGDCSFKAFRIKDEKVEIDTCFDKDSLVFSSDKMESIYADSIYKVLKAVKPSKWRQMENDINKINDCDFSEYVIYLNENGKEQVFHLKTIMNCYPKSSKEIMELLDDYFYRMRK
jgi:hypothetical protein